MYVIFLQQEAKVNLSDLNIKYIINISETVNQRYTVEPGGDKTGAFGDPGMKKRYLLELQVKIIKEPCSTYWSDTSSNDCQLGHALRSVSLSSRCQQVSASAFPLTDMTPINYTPLSLSDIATYKMHLYMLPDFSLTNLMKILSSSIRRYRSSRNFDMEHPTFLKNLTSNIFPVSVYFGS